MHSFTRLSNEIFKLSQNQTDWDVASSEWIPNGVTFVSYGDERCLCGHNIHEVCHIKNKYTDKTAYVGNVCIDKFNNTPLIEQTKTAFRVLDGKPPIIPCSECGKPTTREEGYHVKCTYLHHTRICKSKEKKYEDLISSINLLALPSNSRDFITTSVKYCIVNDKDFTQKQQKYLDDIIRKYPA